MARRVKHSWPAAAAAPPTCELCGREHVRLTVHHLTPRIQGRRRGMALDELPTAQLCGPCHKYVHSTFTNAELERDFPTLDALRAHEGVARFVKWVQKQPASKGVRVR